MSKSEEVDVLKRLQRSKKELGKCIESDQFDSYPKGQLGVAFRIIEKYENVILESGLDAI